MSFSFNINIGVGYSIPGDIADDGSVDVSTNIQDWINTLPDGATLEFGVGKTYCIEPPAPGVPSRSGAISLTGRTGLTINGNGSTFKQNNPVTTDNDLPMWVAHECNSLTYENMAIVGNWPYPGDIRDETIQHTHGISLLGSDALVQNVEINNVAGDAVYFGLGAGNSRSSGRVNIVTVSGPCRNGIGLIACDDVLVEDSDFTLIGYDVFDFEPNPPAGNGCTNCTVDGNRIHGFYGTDKGGGIIVGGVAFSVLGNAPLSGILFQNNEFLGCELIARSPDTPTSRPANVQLLNNTSDTAGTKVPISFYDIDGITITGNHVHTPGGTMAELHGCTSVSVSGNTYPGGATEYTSGP